MALPEAKKIPKFVKVGSQHIAFSVMRVRTLLAAILEKTFVWVGAEGDDMLEEFLEFFAMVVSLGVDAFAGVDAEGFITRARREYAQRQGVELWPNTDTKDILCPSAGRHYDHMRALLRDGCKVGTKLLGVSGDVSQNPQEVHRAGPWMPALTRSSQMVCLAPAEQEGHIYTANELSFMHGLTCADVPLLFYTTCAHFTFNSWGTVRAGFNARVADAGLQPPRVQGGVELRPFADAPLYAAKHARRRLPLGRDARVDLVYPRAQCTQTVPQ